MDCTATVQAHRNITTAVTTSAVIKTFLKRRVALLRTGSHNLIQAHSILMKQSPVSLCYPRQFHWLSLPTFNRMKRHVRIVRLRPLAAGYLSNATKYQSKPQHITLSTSSITNESQPWKCKCQAVSETFAVQLTEYATHNPSSKR